MLVIHLRDKDFKFVYNSESKDNEIKITNNVYGL